MSMIAIAHAKMASMKAIDAFWSTGSSKLKAVGSRYLLTGRAGAGVLACCSGSVVRVEAFQAVSGIWQVRSAGCVWREIKQRRLSGHETKMQTLIRQSKFSTAEAQRQITLPYLLLQHTRSPAESRVHCSAIPAEWRWFVLAAFIDTSVNTATGFDAQL